MTSRRKLGVLGLLVSALLPTMALAPAIPAANAAATGSTLRVATYNVYHGVGATGAASWQSRSPHVIAQINGLGADVIGLQEVRKNEGYIAGQGYILDQVKAGIAPTYATVPTPQAYLDAVNSPQVLAYRTSKFAVMDSGYLVYPTGFGCENYNVYSATWARLRDKVTDARYLVATTHMTATDGGASCATLRLEQARLLKNRLAVLMRDNNWKTPVIVVGDLNSAPGGGVTDLMEEPKSYVVNGETRSYKIGHPVTIPTLNAGYHTGLPGTSDPDSGTTDYTYYEPAKLSRTAFGVVRNPVVIDGELRTASDHYPVWVDLKVD